MPSYLPSLWPNARAYSRLFYGLKRRLSRRSRLQPSNPQLSNARTVRRIESKPFLSAVKGKAFLLALSYNIYGVKEPARRFIQNSRI